MTELGPRRPTAPGEAASRLVGMLPAIAFLGLVSVRMLGGHADEALFDADALYLRALFQDLAVGGYGIAGWSLPPAPYFFPDGLVYGLVLLLTRDVRVAAGLYALVQTSALLVAVRVLLGAALRERRAPPMLLDALTGGVGLTLLFAAAGGVPIANRLGAPAVHVGTAIVSLLLLAGVLRQIERPRRGRLAIMAVAAFLTALSDGLLLLWLIVPGLAVAAIAARRSPEHRRPIVNVAGVVGGASILGWVAARVLLPQLFSLADYLSWTPEAVPRSARVLLATPAAFLDPSALVFAVAWLAGLGVAARARVRRSTTAADALAGYVVAVVSIGVTATVLLGLHHDIHGLRYLLVPLLAPPILLAIAVGRRATGAHRPRPAIVLAIAIATAVATVALLAATGPPRRRGGLGGYRPPGLGCVERLVRHHHLDAGLADHWRARPLRLFSRRGLQVHSVHPDGRPRHWVNNLDRLHSLPGRPGPRFDFIVVDGLDPEALRTAFGEADRVESCGGLEIWIYDRGRLHRRFEPMVRALVAGLSTAPTATPSGPPRPGPGRHR